MQPITEDEKLQDTWYKQAKEMTLEELPAFLKSLMEDYRHDYGTICHALAAGAVATTWALNKHPNGGITGFQAGAVMWEFIKEWNYSSNKCGMKLLDYDNLLYPQYEDKFQNTISTEQWKLVQQEAADLIRKADEEKAQYVVDAEQYKVDLADFVSRYPDYNQNKEHYDHLGMGTGDQWDAYYKKKESGFEFAPREPGYFLNQQVYQHWKSIASGHLPFGFHIKD